MALCSSSGSAIFQTIPPAKQNTTGDSAKWQIKFAVRVDELRVSVNDESLFRTKKKTRPRFMLSVKPFLGKNNTIQTLFTYLDFRPFKHVTHHIYIRIQ